MNRYIDAVVMAAVPLSQVSIAAYTSHKCIFDIMFNRYSDFEYKFWWHTFNQDKQWAAVQLADLYDLCTGFFWRKIRAGDIEMQPSTTTSFFWGWGIVKNIWFLRLGLTQTSVCEPGCVGVEVDVFYMDWRAVAGTPGDADTHQRVLLLGRHHHLKQSHRAGQREVKMLQPWRRKRENLRTVDVIWKPCWCFDFGHRKGTILHFLLAADLSGMYLNKHELVHWLVPLQQHHAGLQAATQKHATSLQVVSCRGRDAIKEQADTQSFVTAGHRFNPNYYKTCSLSAIQTSLTV